MLKFCIVGFAGFGNERHRHRPYKSRVFRRDGIHRIRRITQQFFSAFIRKTALRSPLHLLLAVFRVLLIFLAF